MNEIRAFEALASAIRYSPASLTLPAVAPAPAIPLNIVLPSLTLGGAERCVTDVVSVLDLQGQPGNLFVLGEVAAEYETSALRHFTLVRPQGPDRATRIWDVAARIAASQNRTAVTHMIRARDLQVLWRFGIRTIPVVHNSRPGWHDPVDAYHSSDVPFVIAVSQDVARQLIDAGLKKPVTVLRHEVSHRTDLEFAADRRSAIRSKYGIADDVTLIGMVGQFKAHKAYVRAARALAEVRRCLNAKLMILGGWDHEFGAGRVAHAAFLRQVEQLELAGHVICPGPVKPVEDYYSAFDVFLNTSVYEGLSIATLEAKAAGCPIVCTDVGGQREALGSSDWLVPAEARPADFCAAILEASRSPRRMTEQKVQPDLVPRLWAWMSRFGVGTPAGSDGGPILFVTSNLNPGGAQRSLTNLLIDDHWKPRSWLCILDAVFEDGFLEQLRSARVPCFSLSASRNLMDKVERFLSFRQSSGAPAVCFWNADPVFKLIVTKALEQTSVRIVDVSPGPMLFSEMAETSGLQDRLAFSSDRYFGRLGSLVSKYDRRATGEELLPNEVVVRNGVPKPRTGAIDESLVMPGRDPRFAIVTCCRLVPNKQLDRLVELMSLLARLDPRVSLTVVGGLEQRHAGYFERIERQIGSAGLSNMHFAGPRPDPFRFLPAFRLFVMMSRAQGCPNASLEAMACGLPVVADSDGGTSEQVIQGWTGYVEGSIDRLAGHIIDILRDDSERDRLGRNGAEHAASNFSMEAMAEAYREILAGESSCPAKRQHESESSLALTGTS